MEHAPIFIGGIGGSGTRAVEQVFAHTNLQRASLVNESNDYQWFTFLFKQPRFYGIKQREGINDNLELFKQLVLGKPLTQKEEHTIFSEAQAPEEPFFKRFWPHHVSQKVDVAKEPNMMYFIPELGTAFSQSKFILVVRNPLEMAISSNQQQLHYWGTNFGISHADSMENRLLFWLKAHQYALEKLKEFYSDRFLLVDYNALGENTETELKRLMKFCGCVVSDNQLQLMAKDVKVVKKNTSALAIDDEVKERVMGFYRGIKKD